tara:strand:- start:16592 stop:18265 length:1674 start_codon:yes stop_codon:yes gene_type:complete
MEDTIYIFGHKNPDADSICGAIAYAAYKEAIGQEHYKPARCGNSNDRIDAILERFETPLPTFIGDITPRVHDIMIKEPKKAPLDLTCVEALEVMDQHNLRALPVVNEENKLQGLVSISQLGTYFVPKLKDPHNMRYIYTSLDAIVRSLKAEVLHLINPEPMEDLYVRVSAMAVETFNTLTETEKIPAGQSVIVVGDREDIQDKALEMGVRMLVITGGLPINGPILEKAKQKGVSLVISPYDSATTAWIVRSASNLTPLIEDNVVTCRADEKLCQVKRKVANTPTVPVYLVVDDNHKLLGVFSKTDLLKPVETKIVLVDHNEITQAVNGADQVIITEIIDHHRLGNLPTQQPILFHNEPVGSTCTIVADLFRREGIKPSANLAGIMMSGMISDTLNLQSPTSTPKDALLLDWLEGIAKISRNELSDLIFSSGSVILNSKPEDVITTDCKIYEEGSVRYSVSQVEELGLDNFWNHAEAIDAALEDFQRKESLYFSALLVTDINTQDSILLYKGNVEFRERITYPLVKSDNIFELRNVVSRKKQLIPYISDILETLGVVN